ncbi:MAG: peptidoglycan editing factor PgeF [Deltaproteobacteria bacterium]
MNPEKIQSDLFKSFYFLSHGFLTRALGNQQAAGIAVKKVCRLKQVHSNRVVVIPNEVRDLSRYKKEEADAMVTKLKGIALTIVTADCIPLLFCDPSKKIIAAAHAGWRGTSANVARMTVQKMIEWGSDPKNIFVALGPSVQKCCYEVDRRVYDAPFFGEHKNLFEPVSGKKGHWRVSLPHVNREQLKEGGVLKEHIWISPLCTACLGEDFYSYRREGEKAGRQWSYVALM